MKIAETKYKRKKQFTNTKKEKKKLEEKPEWFDKEIKQTKASDEEIKELEELLKI